MSSFGGRLWGRVAVEGWPEVFVTHQSMVQTLADGRSQIVSLILDSVSLSVDVSLAHATIESEGFSVTLADIAGAVTASLAKVPTANASLTADISTSATSMTVDSTADFASAGLIHIGTEAIKYTGKTATTFTGLTRGAWGTIAQKHIVPGGEGRLYPLVTEIPQGLRGRRAYLYVYDNEADAIAAGDPDPSDTDIMWRGIAASDRKYNAAKWTFQIKPITAIFDQEIGTDLAGEIGIRGVYYPVAAAFVFAMYRLSTASSDGGVTVDRFDQFYDATATATSRAIGIVGFYETQRLFLDALQTEIDTRVAVWLGSGWAAAGNLLTWQETESGFRLVYRTGSTPYYLAIANILPISAIDSLAAPTNLYWVDTTGAAQPTLATDTTYYMEFNSNVPRAAYGRTDPRRREAPQFVDPADRTFPASRIYLGGDIVPTTDMLVELTSGELDDVPEHERLRDEVDSVSTTDRWIEVRAAAPWEAGLVRFGPGTRFKFARLLATGTIEDLRSALVTNSPDLHTSGGSPLVSADDVPSWSTEIDAAIGGMRLGRERRFITRDGKSLWDILAEEWKFIGVHPTLDSQGRLVVKRLRLASATDTATASLTSTNTLGGFPALERNSYGTLGTVLYRTGYDSDEDEHLGRTYKARSLRALGINPSAGVLEIAPLSESRSVTADGLELDPRDVVEASSRVLGIFGAPYDLVTLTANWDLRTVRPGDTVSITSALLPATDGTMGASALAALATGTKADLSQRTVALSCFVTLQSIAGYAPSYRVTSSAVVSGFQYDVTLDYSDYADAFPGDVLAVGDAIEIRQRDTRTPTRETGVVDVVTSGSAVVRVTLGAAIPSGSLSFEYDDATAVGITQEIYAFVGGSDRRVDFTSGTVRSKDYAP